MSRVIDRVPVLPQPKDSGTGSTQVEGSMLRGYFLVKDLDSIHPGAARPNRTL
jgi:hypothetical protein